MRIRRRMLADRPGSESAPWGRLLRDIGLVVTVSVSGYLFSAWWVSPSPLFGAAEHSTPHVLGLSEAEARERLSAFRLRPRVGGERTHPTRPPGTVVWQDPPPGVVLSPNSVVLLTLSAGSAPVPVPDVIGLDTATASRILTAAGAKVGEITIVAGGREPGIVVATRPSTGVARPRGATVGLVVSHGPKESP